MFTIYAIYPGNNQGYIERLKGFEIVKTQDKKKALKVSYTDALLLAFMLGPKTVAVQLEKCG
jgi:hypothetical protein